jgi:DNA-binding response OmpR family regulator
MTEAKPKIVLMIDDDLALASLLARFLQKYGFKLLAAGTAKEGLKEIERAKPEAVLLDINLPEASGLDLCREIRDRSPVPIIMISSLADTADRVLGLQVGADSYLPKPFEPRELVAHLEALLRRVKQLSVPVTKDLLVFDDLTIDLSRREVTRGTNAIDLSSAEFDLLAVLITKPGHVFSRDEILNRLKGVDWEVYNRSIDLIVSRIRKKLGDTPKQCRFLKTVRGTGYVFLPAQATRKAG